MSSLLIRDLEPETKTALQAQAARNGRSMTAEARAILRQALRPEHQITASAAAVAREFFPERLRVEGGIDGLYGDDAPAEAPDFG